MNLGFLVLLLLGSAGDGTPVDTPFQDARALFAPADREGFIFAILGDRTTGPESGLAVLDQAVTELNRLDPDLVFTVGDHINGYNAPAEWMAQMRRYFRLMSRLKMPWFPTPGNHDVYSKGGDPKDRTNEKLYLQHFGPLYYSFEFKKTLFLVLYSDENLSFRDPPRDQQMSVDQLAWIEETLARSRAMRAFVFLHHPRWTYGGDVWEPVHKVLAASGKVEAVFAGHLHTYRSDGERDGIRYYCMATTGAYRDDMEAGGCLDHYNLVSVRKEGWGMTVIPVGAVLDPDFVTGAESDELFVLKRNGFVLLPDPFPAPVEGPVEGRVRALLRNPVSKTLDVDLTWEGLPEKEWRIEPKSVNCCLEAGEERALEFVAQGGVPNEGCSLPRLALRGKTRYGFEKGGAQEILASAPLVYEVPPLPEALTKDVARPGTDRALFLDGQDDCLVVSPSPDLNPEDAFTLECWARLQSPAPRSALLAKTESSAYGIFLSDGDRRGPCFYLYLEGQGYVQAMADEEALHVGEWVHLAGVFTGDALRLYVNGYLAAQAEAQGRMRPNELPLVGGGEVDRRGRPQAFAEGLIDEVRLSLGARYLDAFEPPRRFANDGETVLLLHLDTLYGDVTPDVSGQGHHARIEGGASLVAWEADDRKG